MKSKSPGRAERARSREAESRRHQEREYRAAYSDMARLIQSHAHVVERKMSARAWMVASRKYRKQRLRIWARLLDTLHESDYPSILEVLKFQLAWTRQALVRNNIVTDCRKSAAEIKVVEDLLGRVAGEAWHHDHFVGPLMRKFEKKYGRWHLEFLPVEGERGTSRMISKFGKHNEDDLPGVRVAVQRASEKAEQARRADLERACRLLGEGVLGWWD